ncbi:mimecan isoform X2 [Bos indicus x Bos taurus]|uniref:mimecan isoform X2 n=1 Tax=Bos indicus x Bos taurus TaxID=30522 RepID=UPI000F7D1686|nr:mimecan isoform X2 [Bos indicus x Bos taurus]
MKTLQSTLLLFLFVPLIKPAPPSQQDSRIIYDYGTDNLEETFFSQDYEDKYLDGKSTKEKETMIIVPDEKSFQLQKDENITPLPPKKENDANLRRLDFTGNLIEDIEDGTFSKLSLLEELTLAENQLLKLPVLPPKLTLFNAKYNKIKSRGIKANTFKKLHNLSFLYLDHNALESVPLNLPESLRVIHLQFNNITSITDDTFCKANDTSYIRDRIEEIRLEGNPVILGKHPNSFICLKRLPIGSYI